MQWVTSGGVALSHKVKMSMRPKYTLVPQDDSSMHWPQAYGRRSELVASARPRLWRNLLVGTVAIMLIVGGAIAGAIITKRNDASAFTHADGHPSVLHRQSAELPESASLTDTKNGIELGEVLNGTFSTASFNGTWISDTEFLYKDTYGALSIFDVDKLSSTTIVSSKLMDNLRPFKYSLSPSRKYLLLVHDVQKLFRFSFLARHTILNLDTGATTPLSPQQVSSRLTQPPLLFAEWAPKSDAIVFVFHSDIYYATSPQLTTMYRLTNTGQIGTIFNGVPDWVYEEEILSSNSALWFSPSGRYLAFATFNDTNVDSMNFPLYGRPGDLTFQYPLPQSVKYPKPGRPNPVVDIWVVDLGRLVSEDGETVSRLPPPASLASKDHYFTTVGWSETDLVSVTWMNRRQNINIISICTPSATCTEDLVHTSPDQAWNDLYNAPMFDKQGSKYLIVLPTSQGEHGYFKHVNLRDTEAKTIVPLTTGTYEVTDILAWDEVNHIIYFSGAPSGKPAQRHLYFVGDLNHQNPKQAYCITCEFKNDYAEDCNYNSGDVSKKQKYYALTCGGPGIPQVTLHRASDHTRVALLENNNDVREHLIGRALPLVKRLEIEIEGGFKAQVSMKLPPDYNPASSKTYPMLVYVYGGPGSQLVSDRFKIDWGDYLSSSRGIIYTSIDGRGSGYAGDKILHTLNNGLGTSEVADQLDVTAKLQRSFPSIDKTRTAIWGWSYGGYVTAAALSRDFNNVFKCGISVAPVTSWIYYDTVYTERYMGLPTVEDNLKAYNDSDVTQNVKNFRNKEFFLIHGTADDNVHYQQSMMLSRSLEVNDILFRSQSYPDENHGLAGVKRHHYHSMEDFLNDCYNEA